MTHQRLRSSTLRPENRRHHILSLPGQKHNNQMTIPLQEISMHN